MEPARIHAKARSRAVMVLVVLALASKAVAVSVSGPNTDGSDLFETKIRPLLADHCYQCHSATATPLKGELRLDQPDLLLKGGKSGPVIVAGDPDSSLLIKAVRYTDADLKMPPKGKRLSPDQVAQLEHWVRMGAPVPASSPDLKIATATERARTNHWAFRPVHKPTPPPVSNTNWVQTPVDNFVLALLEKQHLSPAPAADRRTLIRRVTYDLTGLPPTAEEVDAFLNDRRSNSYSELVERLLASPHYGERWGRYWLDVARYADTKGYLAGGEERRYAFSYTYRDYVVAAFNEDKPYDKFITEQLAADLLPLGEDKRPLAALGFLTLGRRFLNNQNDIIDDRIDVVTRGTMALTVACARCHDHKFDPIPTADYYSLHGVFASSHEPAELPLLENLRDSPSYQDYLKQRKKIEEEIVHFKNQQVDKFLRELHQHVGDYLLGAHEAQQLSDLSKLDTFAGEHKLNPKVLRRWLNRKPDNQPDSIFDPWIQLSKAGDSPADIPSILAKLNAQPGLNSEVVKSLAASVTNSLKQAAGAYNQLLRAVDVEWEALNATALKENRPAPSSLPDPEREALRQVLYAEGAPFNPGRDQVESIVAQPISDGTAPMRNKIEALNWTHPGAPARAMALVDGPNPHNSHVLLRGNGASPAQEVPRRFLQVLCGSDRPAFTNGSGRLELAKAIVSPSNPLTPRVYVNRVWLHHFGEGLVKTPGDFGVRTDPPVHRLLLDYLAASLVENGWSTKSLHRLILLSATYQQVCEASTASLSADPENSLYSHMNRQRLDFEAARDTLLAVSGKLDLTLGGLPVDIESEPFSTRRTIYALIDRQNLPGIFRTFDFANPDTSSQQRFHTTVPQQALFLMNSPFVIQQARHLAQRTEVANASSDAERVQALYRLALQRKPDGVELAAGTHFLSIPPQPNAKLTPQEQYAQVLLLSDELMFPD
jgi:mono/diheme cytochrome c family protein